MYIMNSNETKKKKKKVLKSTCIVVRFRKFTVSPRVILGVKSEVMMRIYNV